MHYVIAQIRITDPERYGAYQARFMETLEGTSGRLLAADTSPEIVEGTWPHEKLVLLSFPDRDAFLSWSESQFYRAIAVDRRAGAEGSVLLVRGI